MNILGIQIGKQAVPSTLTRAGTSDGLWEATMKVCLSSPFTLLAQSGVQTAFPTTCDVWTLEANTTYEVSGCYVMTTGTTTKTTAIAFLSGGGLTISSMDLQVIGANVNANATVTTTNNTRVTQLASTVVTATSTNDVMICFKGHIRVNVGGTLTPQINFSANPTGTNTMDTNSWISFIPMGDGSFLKVGSVA